ncbi:MAG: hypothetical protein R2854_31025 [Caldilineaceae bacterium]
MVHGRNEARAQALCAELGDARPTYWPTWPTPTPTRALLRRPSPTSAHSARWSTTPPSPRSNLETTDPALFDWIVAVNLRSPMFAIQAAVNEFPAQGRRRDPQRRLHQARAGGRVEPAGIFRGQRRPVDHVAQLGQHAGDRADPGQPPQRGLGDVGQRDRAEAGRGACDPAGRRVCPRYAPFGRLLTPEQVAQHILFWISDESYPANGCVYELEQYSFIRSQREQSVRLAASIHHGRAGLPRR